MAAAREQGWVGDEVMALPAVSYGCAGRAPIPLMMAGPTALLTKDRFAYDGSRSGRLRGQPDFFQKQPELLNKLMLPHDVPGATSLVTRQLGVLREQPAPGHGLGMCWKALSTGAFRSYPEGHASAKVALSRMCAAQKPLPFFKAILRPTSSP